MIDPWDVLQGLITAFAYDLFKRSAKALAKILVKLPEKPKRIPALAGDRTITREDAPDDAPASNGRGSDACRSAWLTS